MAVPAEAMRVEGDGEQIEQVTPGFIRAEDYGVARKHVEVPDEVDTPDTSDQPEDKLFEDRKFTKVIRVGFDTQEALMPDPTKQSREEAIEFAFTPRKRTTGRLVHESISKVGRSRFVTLRPSSAFIAPQTRETYDQTYYTRLGRSMRDDYGGQLEHGAVGIHDEDHIEAYLADLNDYWETNISVDEVPYHRRFGRWIIMMSGHNRLLGAASANVETNGHPDRGIGFEARVFDNPPFYQALKVQANENSNRPIEPWEWARMLGRIVTLRERDGDPVTNKELADLAKKDMGTVWRMLRFNDLPGAMKREHMENGLSFEGVSECARLLKIYSEKDAIGLVQMYSEQAMSAVQIRSDIATRERLSELPDNIRLLIHTEGISYTQAEELARMKRAGLGDDLIYEKAIWIRDFDPELPKLVLSVDKAITDYANGMRSAFHFDTSVEGSEREAKASEYARRASKAARTKALNTAANTVVAAKSGLLNGDAAEVVGDQALAKTINNTMHELLARIGEGVDVELAQQLLEHLSQLEHDDDPALVQLIAQMNEVIELESTESVESQLRRQKELIERVLPPKQVEQTVLAL